MVLLAGSFSRGTCRSSAGLLATPGEFLIFNGHEPHSSDESGGKRFSCVFHDRGQYDATTTDRDLLNGLGFPRPVRPNPPAQELGACRFLYLFAGSHRQAAVKDYLEAAIRAVPDGAFSALEAVEVDVLRDPVEHDLLSADRQEDFRRRVAEGEFDFVMVTPPCNTFSRAVLANAAGPPPLRNCMLPLGVPVATEGAPGQV